MTLIPDEGNVRSPIAALLTFYVKNVPRRTIARKKSEGFLRRTIENEKQPLGRKVFVKCVS